MYRRSTWMAPSMTLAPARIPASKREVNSTHPSLRGVYRTAPYLHLGSAESLLSVLTTQNSNDLHGTTSQLSGSELDDLVAFMESLGNDDDGFVINAGLNDAWYDPRQDGQGFFVIVYPVTQRIFLAWFTYDTEPPDGSTAAVLGDKGHQLADPAGKLFGQQRRPGAFPDQRRKIQ